MNRLRAVLPIIALAATIAVAGCSKKVPPPLPAAPPSQPAAVTPAPPPPPPPPPSRAATPPAQTQVSEDETFARKSLDQLNAERPLDDVFFDLDKSEIRSEARGALQKDSDWMKRWTEHPDHARRSLRFARQLRVQPRARIAARHGRQRVPREPGRAGRSADRREQGQGTALLQGRERVLLAAEPPRTLRGHREVAGKAEREAPSATHPPRSGISRPSFPPRTERESPYRSAHRAPDPSRCRSR